VNEPEMYIICMPDFVPIAGPADPEGRMTRVFLPPHFKTIPPLKKSPGESNPGVITLVLLHSFWIVLFQRTGESPLGRRAKKGALRHFVWVNMILIVQSYKGAAALKTPAM